MSQQPPDDSRQEIDAQALLQAFTGVISEFAYALDTAGRVMYASDSAEPMFGFRPEELIGRHFLDFIEPASADAAREAFEAAVRHNRHAAGLVIGLRRKDGTTLQAELHGSAVVRDGVTIGAFGLIRDITERLRAEQRLRESEERYRVVVGHTSDAVFVVQDGRFAFVNEACLQITGLAESQLIGLPITAVLPIQEQTRAVERSRRLASGELQRDTTDFDVVMADGSTRILQIRSVRVQWGGAPATLNFAIDVTEERAAESALRASEQRYRELFESINDAVFVNAIDAGNEPGRFLQVNDVACRRLGYTREELLAMTPRDISTPESYARASVNRTHLAELGSTIIESVHVAKDGRRIDVESSIRRIDFHGTPAALSIARDIGERRKAEAERLDMERRMLHVQKLESLGVLAGGIAHDFNNILVAVLGYADLAMAELPPSSSARENVAEIGTAARRAAELCRQMLAYSGRGQFVVGPIRLSDLVTDAMPLLRASVSKKARLSLALPERVPLIHGDATQIRQVLMNLVTNASEALGDREGVVTLTTGSVDAGAADLARAVVADGAEPGRFAYLEVTDTGCGMDAATLARVFEPFFTTKFTGRGLGMAAVSGIVRGHKGAILVETAAGAGTTFRVLFPAQAHVPAPAAAPTSADTAPWSGSGTVLVVDDEAPVRRLAGRMFERLGFSVVEAADGREALEQFDRHRDAVVAVLLDLSMPGMDGEETFRALRRLHPGARVVVSSGYSEHETIARLGSDGLAGFVQKPYSFAALREVMQKAMDRRLR